MARWLAGFASLLLLLPVCARPAAADADETIWYRPLESDSRRTAPDRRNRCEFESYFFDADDTQA